MDLSDIEGIGPAYEKRLKEAGVATAEDLAGADPASLSKKTGIALSRLETFIARAGERLAGAPREESASSAGSDAAEAAAMAAPSPGDATYVPVRVVLHDRATSARVIQGERVHENLPIVTARANEDEEEIMDALSQDAVLLKERATTAFVRLSDGWHVDVPIYKEKVVELESGGTSMEEVRVKVQEIREKKEPKKGLFAKIFGR